MNDSRSTEPETVAPARPDEPPYWLTGGGTHAIELRYCPPVPNRDDPFIELRIVDSRSSSFKSIRLRLVMLRDVAAGLEEGARGLLSGEPPPPRATRWVPRPEHARRREAAVTPKAAVAAPKDEGQPRQPGTPRGKVAP